MDGNIINVMILIMGASIGLTIVIGIIMKISQNYLAQTKEICAIVIDKQKYDQIVMNKVQAPYKQTNYIIAFKTKAKILRFNVSEYSYNNYYISQKGTLKYKGDKIIDFSV